MTLSEKTTNDDEGRVSLSSISKAQCEEFKKKHCYTGRNQIDTLEFQLKPYTSPSDIEKLFRSSHIALIEAEIARKEKMLKETREKYSEFGLQSIEGEIYIIQDDLTYLRGELEKIK